MSATPLNNAMIRWGIIGCGNVTEVKSGPAYQQTTGFQLTAVMRRNKALAQDYAQRHNVAHYFDDASEVIDNPNIDAVYIATPPDTHKLYGLMVAAAGKPCCIEKPLAPSYEDSLAISQAFEQAKQPLFVAYYRRSLPRFTKVKALLDSKAIGDIRHINWQLTKPASAADLSKNYQWRTDKNIALGGYFDDLASHGLDLFAYLLGDYQLVQGIATNQQQLYSAFDAISACWQHTNGISGTGSWNFGCSGRKDSVTIYGSEGELSFSVFEEAAITLTSAGHSENIFIENPEHIQRFHVDNIRAHLAGEITHPSTGKTALHTSWMMEQILSSSLP